MKTVIGRYDKADFPELMLKNLSVKTDTGAYTSSIHCHDIQEIEAEGEAYIEFYLLDPSHPKYVHKKFKTKQYERKVIKSSFGESEERYIISTIIIMFGQEYPIELSLSERSNMKYPVLLGRKFLNKKFVVDTSVKNVSFQQKQQTAKKKE
ncbi:RimK/LysX family protein [uncultured Microscilla sp.]|uniref:ATP-dependent zinc protease family protein n=1 Tax=uncultured Microscilla sp. TaxID=432653 RepID=UPI00260EF9CC|nr:RimK/LysX family protein [uncultured Microscilla sp.]